MKIDILGAKYTIVFDKTDKNPKLEGAAGYCDMYDKKIVIQAMFDDDVMNSERIDLFMAKVLRHEIIHAVFHEAGMDEYSVDETLVDLLAIQIPKIAEILNKVSKKL